MIGDLAQAAAGARKSHGIHELLAAAERLAETGTSARATLVARRARALLSLESDADDTFQLASLPKLEQS